MKLIDANAFKDYIDCGHLRPPTEVCFSERDVCNMIDKAPTVSAEAVHKPDYSYEADMVRRLKEALSAEAVQGEWIRVGYDIYECSLCHQNVMTKDIDCYSYCHRCGARMLGEDGEA